MNTSFNDTTCQHTLKKTVTFRGIGLHSGKPVDLTINPAEKNSGIRFTRTDMTPGKTIPAFMNRVVDTRLATTIAENETVIATTEHLLAALSGMGIDNALIQLNGAEVPIMDGSAGPFVHVLKKAGKRRQKAGRRLLKITREISFEEGDKRISIQPHDGLRITAEIDFDHEAIQRQACTFDISPERFTEEIASARTFGFIDEVEELQKNGLALGGSLDNAIVVDRLGVLNKEGLRFPNEFVRHKILDLIGDLALLGCPVLGHVTAYKSGHGQHWGLMNEIAAHPECWEYVSLAHKGKTSHLDRALTTTKAAGNMILPFLAPHSTPLAGETCPVCL